MIEDIALTVRKSDILPDWWVIERRAHDGSMRIVHHDDGNGAHLVCSSRLGNADIEGYASEMLAIADAIIERDYVAFRRCAVNCGTDGVRLWSPRNSDPDSTPTVPYARALELAKEIRAKVTPTEMP